MQGPKQKQAWYCQGVVAESIRLVQITTAPYEMFLHVYLSSVSSICGDASTVGCSLEVLEWDKYIGLCHQK